MQETWLLLTNRATHLRRCMQRRGWPKTPLPIYVTTPKLVVLR